MTARIDRRDPPPRSPSAGPAFVYVLPCAYEDYLKLGHSRDPLERMQTLHRRWYEFFDLERGLLVETDRVREARRIELALGHALAEHSAPAPLTIPRSAAGHTEWYRGALSSLSQAVAAFAEQSYVVHAPLREWARERLRLRGDRLFEWTQRLWQARMQGEVGEASLERHLRDTLDGYVALDVPPWPWLSREIAAWYRGE